MIRELLPDPMFSMHADRELGPRNNLSFEGLSFSQDKQSLWVVMGAPLWQDGPVPTPLLGATVRFTQYSREGEQINQLAYPVDAIPETPGIDKFADNGVSAILALDEQRLLVVERAAVQNQQGKFKNFIRIYVADTSAARDVSGIESLLDARYQALSKELLLDLTSLDELLKVDNIEGIAWGPLLDNGNKSLVLVSDDNFNRSQVTQLLAFEVVPVVECFGP